MPLFKNTFQPYFPDPDSPAPKDCVGSFCYPIAAGDVIKQEWYQTPCAANMVVDPLFDNLTLGANMITNGTFTGSAAGWTLGADWSYTTNAVQYDAGATVTYLTQSGIGLVAGTLYRVTFYIGVGVGGGQVMLGNATGAIISDPIYSSGIYTLDMLYNDTDDIIQFFPLSPGDVIAITNVSVQAITMNDWVAESPVWNFGDGVACKTIAGVGDLYNGASDYIVAGDYYEVNVIISGSGGAGTLTVYIDDGTGTTATNLQTAISANGIYPFYITASQDGVIAFSPSSDFTGCISTPSVRRLRNDFYFSLINAVGDVVDISSTATYTENKININVDLAALTEDGIIDGYGCYTIHVTDTCLVSGDNLVQDGDFSNGDFSEWQRNSGAWQYAAGGGIMEYIFEPQLDNPTVVSNGDFVSGATGWTAGAGWAVGVGSAVHTPGSTATLSQTITISAPAVLPLVLYTWFQVRITGRLAGSVTLSVSDRTSAAMSTNDTHTNVFVPTIGGSVTLAITPTSNFDGTIELIHVSEATRSWNSKPILSNPINSNVVAGNYQLTYDITSITGTTINTIGASASIRYPLLGYTYNRAVATHSHTQDYDPGSTIIEIQGIFDANSNYYPGRVTVDNYSVVRIEPFEATFISECLNFDEVHPGTTLVTAWCDQDALGSTPADNLGFVTTGFELQMRIVCRSLNPILKTEGNNAFFSDGDAALKYAQMEKYWQFVTDYMSESALTALGGMIRCDHFTIGEDGSAATEYLAEMDDLSPNWLQDGSYNLAPVTITIRKSIGGMKFNRHT